MLSKQNINLDNIEQHGGFPTLIPAIGKFIASVVASVLQAIKDGLIALLNPKVWKTGQGLLWKYMWWCLKVAFYLVVFSFGGPLLILIGIIMLYSNLAKKVSTLKTDKEMEEEDENQGEVEEGADAEED